MKNSIQMEDEVKKSIIVARVLIGLLLFASLLNIVSWYQTKMQIVSDLIPESVIYEVSKPYRNMGLFLAMILVISIVIYFFKKYWWVVGLCAVALAIQLIFIFFSL